MTAKVVHCKRDEYDVYIGRPSKWGNPFSHLPNTLAEYKMCNILHFVVMKFGPQPYTYLEINQ